MTTINDRNIRQYVRYYFENRNNLPNDLREIPIGNWIVSAVTNMSGLFSNRTTFNEPLNWDVSNVKDMSQMFLGCRDFNQPLNWDVRNVRDMSEMFMMCRNFNQDLSNWGETMDLVQNMRRMFYECSNFNGPLNDWFVRYVTNMYEMFYQCINFNQPLNNWEVNNVTDMRRMFYGCVNFNQDLSSWKTLPYVDADHIFTMSGVTPENQIDFEVVTDTDSADSADSEQYSDYGSEYDEPMAPLDHELIGNHTPPSPNSPHSPQAAPGNGLQPIVEVPIHHGEPIHMTQTTEIFSILDGVHIPATELPPPADVNSILFYQNNNYILTNTEQLRRLIDRNSHDNALVLICRREMVDALDIREPDLRDTTIYANTQKLLGLGGGYIRASYVLAALNHRAANTTENVVYVLTPDPRTPPAPTVVSLEYYVSTDPDAFSASHCQAGRGGPIYNIVISEYDIVGRGNKKRTKRNKGKKRNKSNKVKKPNNKKGKKSNNRNKGTQLNKGKKLRKNKKTRKIYT